MAKMSAKAIRSPPEKALNITVPLLIRLLEYAREDAKNDLELHNIAERAIKIGGVLESNSYAKLVPNDKEND